jgi:PAS domain S-box-containing protein
VTTDIQTEGRITESEPPGRRILPTLAVVAMCLAGTGVSAWVAQHEVASRERALFDRILDGIEVSLERTEQMYEQVLLGLAAYVRGIEDISEDQWTAYLDGIQRQTRLPEINDIGLIAFNRDHIAGEWSANTRLVTLSDGKTVKTTGRNLMNDPSFSAALTRLIEDKTSALTTAVPNRFAMNGLPGYALITPVSPPDTSDAISQAVFASFSGPQLLEAVVSGSTFQICVDLFDGADVQPDSFVGRYCNAGAPEDGDFFYEKTRTVTIAGQTLTICLLGERGFYVAPLTVPLGVIIPLGLAITLLMGGLVWYESSTRDRAKTMAMRMTRDLQDSRDRYDRVVRVSGVGFWERDHADHGLLWSDKMYEITGMSQDDDLGSTDRMHEIAHPDDRDRVFAAIAKHIREDQPFSEEFRLWRPDGGEIWIYATATTTRDANGKPLRTTGSVTDITQRNVEEERRRKNERELTETISELRQSQKKLDAALREAESASRAKSTFLSTMSHELRTPLNAILGFSEVIRDNVLNREGGNAYQDYARDIHASGEHLLDLINDILDLAKIEEGQTKLKLETISVAAVVETTLNLMQPRAISKSQSLSAAHIPPDLTVWADKRALKQILFNLIANAVQFTDQGGKISIAAKSTASGGVEIEIRDSGIGIADEDLGRIFNPFERVGSSSEADGFGTGLGLAVVRNLMALHGGNVAVNSELGKGSVFRVTFGPPPGPAES